MNGIQKIAAERTRQIQDENWTPEHDDAHQNGELAEAAAVYAKYATPAKFPTAVRLAAAGSAPPEWPWEPKWFKPTSREDMIIKSGALNAAELDRLERCRILDTSIDDAPPPATRATCPLSVNPVIMDRIKDMGVTKVVAVTKYGNGYILAEDGPHHKLGSVIYRNNDMTQQEREALAEEVNKLLARPNA